MLNHLAIQAYNDRDTGLNVRFAFDVVAPVIILGVGSYIAYRLVTMPTTVEPMPPRANAPEGQPVAESPPGASAGASTGASAGPPKLAAPAPASFKPPPIAKWTPPERPRLSAPSGVGFGDAPEEEEVEMPEPDSLD